MNGLPNADRPFARTRPAARSVEALTADEQRVGMGRAKTIAEFVGSNPKWSVEKTEAAVEIVAAITKAMEDHDAR